MLLRDVMTPHVEVIHPDASLREAAAKMKSLEVGPIPVCDGERLQGMYEQNFATSARRLRRLSRIRP